VPFLTPDTPQVLGLLNFSIVTGIVVNAAYLVYDARWFRALGDLATASIGLAVLARIWQVFPFDFGGYELGRIVLLARAVLILAIVGTVIGILVNFGLLLRHTLGKREGE
jgi:hypothetical protein